jgi:hypothetical protein
MKSCSHVTSSLTSSPTSRFLESEPEPLVSAGGPELAGVHGEEILPATSELPETQTVQRSH